MAVALVAVLGFLWVCLLSRKKTGVNYEKMDKQTLPDGAKLVTYQWNLPYSSGEIIRRLELLDEEDVVGCGGFGTVYKMVMDDGTAFAVKRIDLNRERRDKTFEKELEILGSIRHINLVNLRGYCRLSTAKLLIYDFMELGSLDSYLHGDAQEDQPLNWNARMKIALGSARGLAYLHHDCSPGIVHRDIKASNILLDRCLEPRVSDFGLARLLVDNETHVTTVVAGTFGYLAPEYLQNGHSTEKSDVYSFGVLLLELVTGKRPTDSCFLNKGLNIVGWLNTLSGEHRLEEILDERSGDAEVEAVEGILDIAAMCTDADPGQRPSMGAVLKMLEEEILSPCLSELYYEQHLELCILTALPLSLNQITQFIIVRESVADGVAPNIPAFLGRAGILAAAQCSKIKLVAASIHAWKAERAPPTRNRHRFGDKLVQLASWGVRSECMNVDAMFKMENAAVSSLLET
ncbi:LRR receptor-like serine/threonine-protein kinase FEI 1 [Triticum urartu]|uniref:LRR receptor-like serine/threonine-protein kinase FEI 1 n=1 Tax=Triticum urartu TaxID=4572 RepID=M7ZL85_TRIUA|nr:LRR receptor-like serine/threonine-protein kinase FEI 1 [Triticum urartu]